MPQFSLWVGKDADGRTLILSEKPEGVIAEVYGDSLVEEQFVIKEPTQARERDRERLMMVPNGVGGIQIDRTLEKAASICAYLESWTLKADGEPLPIKMETVDGLPSNLVAAISTAIDSEVYPNPLGPRFFLTLQTKRGGSEATANGSAGESVTPP